MQGDLAFASKPTGSAPPAAKPVAAAPPERTSSGGSIGVGGRKPPVKKGGLGGKKIAIGSVRACADASLSGRL